MINDYIRMYSILPASAFLPLLSSETKPRLPQWGSKTPPTSYYCHPSPLKGPGNTQLLCPISPKKDTTHQVKPIVEVREYVYFLYICIHTLTSRSQLPPFLSWFDYLNIFMYSPHMSHVFLEDHPRSGGLLYPRVKVMLFINSHI